MFFSVLFLVKYEVIRIVIEASTLEVQHHDSPLDEMKV